MFDNIITSAADETLHNPLTADELRTIKDLLSQPRPGLVALRMIALQDPAFAAYMGAMVAREWEDDYDAAYVAERYERAAALILMVIELRLEQQIPTALRDAWYAAHARAYGHPDVVHQPPISDLDNRAGTVQMLGVLTETPGLCQGVAAALRAVILKYDREVWEAI